MMKNFRSEKSHDKIDELMVGMGFMANSNGKYWHMFFGREIEFDLSASGSDKYAVMAHVFKVAIEYGKKDKLDDIKKVLGI